MPVSFTQLNENADVSVLSTLAATTIERHLWEQDKGKGGTTGRNGNVFILTIMFQCSGSIPIVYVDTYSPSFYWLFIHIETRLTASMCSISPKKKAWAVCVSSGLSDVLSAMEFWQNPRTHVQRSYKTLVAVSIRDTSVKPTSVTLGSVSFMFIRKEKGA